MEINNIKKDFPLLENENITYLDSGATTQKPIQVIKAVEKFYQKYNANPHRGAYSLSVEATEQYENTRTKIAKFINARHREEIIFSKNATESLNLIAYSYGLDNIKKDDEVFNINKSSKEKISNLYTMKNKELVEINKAKCGDIVIVTKSNSLQTGDTISLNKDDEAMPVIQFPKPQIYFAITPKDKGDEEKVSATLNKIADEDPTIDWYRNSETKQALIGGQGELHINIVKDKMKEKFGVDVNLEDLKVAYRETVKGKSDVQGKHKKQSGGHGQYGDVKIKFERSKKDFEFTEEIFGGSVPKQYIPAVEKGLKDSMLKGVLAGFPVTNIKATLYDGSYHDVDSSEMAFKMAASLAFRKGMEEAQPVLLEPIMSLKITIPEEYMGDVMGDINKRRGKILGMEPLGKGKQVIYAQAPQAETFKYAINLRSMTQGRGYFEMEIEKYDEVPYQIAQRIIAQANNNR